MSRAPGILGVIVAMAALVSVAPACTFSGDDDNDASDEVQIPLPADGKVEYGEDGNLIETTDFATAMKKLEDRVGFDVVLPTKVPDGFRLTVLGSELTPAEVDASRFPKAYLQFEDGDGVRFFMEELDRKTTASGGTRREVSSGVDGATIEVFETDLARVYWLRMDDRTFSIGVPKAHPVAEEEFIELMRSLARASR